MSFATVDELNPVEQAVLQSAAGGAAPTFCVRTETRVDAGGWLRGTPVWLVCLPEQLVVLVAGRRQYFCVVPLAEARQSHYAHQTGDLVIAPCEELRFRQLAMPPSDAIRVLRFLGQDV